MLEENHRSQGIRCQQLISGYTRRSWGSRFLVVLLWRKAKSDEQLDDEERIDVVGCGRRRKFVEKHRSQSEVWEIR